MRHVIRSSVINISTGGGDISRQTVWQPERFIMATSVLMTFLVFMLFSTITYTHDIRVRQALLAVPKSNIPIPTERTEVTPDTTVSGYSAEDFTDSSQTETTPSSGELSGNASDFWNVDTNGTEEGIVDKYINSTGTGNITELALNSTELFGNDTVIASDGMENNTTNMTAEINTTANITDQLEETADNSTEVSVNSTELTANSTEFPANSTEFPANSTDFPTDWTGTLPTMSLGTETTGSTGYGTTESSTASVYETTQTMETSTLEEPTSTSPMWESSTAMTTPQTSTEELALWSTTTSKFTPTPTTESTSTPATESTPVAATESTLGAMESTPAGATPTTEYTSTSNEQQTTPMEAPKTVSAKEDNKTEGDKDEGGDKSFGEQIREKLKSHEARFILSIMIPVGAGVVGAVAIVGFVYGVKACRRRFRRKRKLRPEETMGMDRVMLLAGSSDEEF
ncbi:PREDICTED: flocculation protein FLO11-like isoform X1 [Branchiostoma belcheri]|uniref:Flocculation protein FLO11-like isoform X1 n=2 Tax=Branchiostoma belcheri TaxID=7741 RepID=A0A6P4YMW8_BRABE|nr:PREDICTED: flocculation protein FLO11-like isoform X1 [Branchiostoma belcheri]XP_019625754.1 PREDICTED: flocculation protein FLO11-like isoform X1 [Branchiostoma belcheri]